MKFEHLIPLKLNSGDIGWITETIELAEMADKDFPIEYEFKTVKGQNNQFYRYAAENDSIYCRVEKADKLKEAATTMAEKGFFHTNRISKTYDTVFKSFLDTQFALGPSQLVVKAKSRPERHDSVDLALNEEQIHDAKKHLDRSYKDYVFCDGYLWKRSKDALFTYHVGNSVADISLNTIEHHDSQFYYCDRYRYFTPLQYTQCQDALNQAIGARERRMIDMSFRLSGNYTPKIDSDIYTAYMQLKRIHLRLTEGKLPQQEMSSFKLPGDFYINYGHILNHLQKSPYDIEDSEIGDLFERMEILTDQLTSLEGYWDDFRHNKKILDLESHKRSWENREIKLKFAL